MRYVVHIESGDDGEYLATCEEPQAVGRGLSPRNALDRLRDELRYRLEMCPCSGIDEDAIELDVS